jgi:glycosyltransferase involved in cell wall biosynthesis
MRIKSICFVARQYPTDKQPESTVFYKNFVHQAANSGIECRVIHPRAMNKISSWFAEDKTVLTEQGNSVTVYRPKMIATFGTKRLIGIKTGKISSLLFTQSVLRSFKSIEWLPDCFYGHFITSGMAVGKLSSITGVPGFIAYGESSGWSIDGIGLKTVRKALRDIRGFIAVSDANKKRLIEYGIAPEEKISVFPNGVDLNFFHQRDRNEARRMLGWDPNCFIVAFVGSFDKRKGVGRLNKAVSEIKNVKVAYAGKGRLIPDSRNAIHIGTVDPKTMPIFLSACDIFVLPTLNEGCSNAILEALACGLPVVSSDADFNRNILDEDNSILVDPESITEIRNAILQLRDDKKLREKLSEGATESAEKSSIQERFTRILSWMESLC